MLDSVVPGAALIFLSAISSDILAQQRILGQSPCTVEERGTWSCSDISAVSCPACSLNSGAPQRFLLSGTSNLE